MQISPTRSHEADPGPLRVVHLFRTPVGGLFRHVCDLAGEQSRLGYDVGIVCDSSTGGARADDALAALAASCTLGVHRLPIRRLPGPSDLHTGRAVSRILARLRPDIVHGHGAKGAAFGRLLARRVGARAIYTPHGGSLHYSRSTIAGLLFLGAERLLLARTDGAIFESNYTAGVFVEKIGQLPCPSSVIHNGIRDDEFLDNDVAAEFDFVYVGEIREIKGILTLMDAISRLADRASFSVAIAGDGELKPAIEQRIAAESLDTTVTLMPPVYPATTIIRKARCIVVPSLAESLPYIVLEAVAAGVPVLATNVGGVPEIFGSFSGNLLPAGDSGALADAMLSRLQDPESYDEITAAMREHTRHNFKLSDMVQQTLQFYDEVLCGSGSRVRPAVNRR